MQKRLSLNFLSKINWLYVLCGLFVLMMLVQLLYPGNRLPPRTYLGTMPIGLETEDQIRSELEKQSKTATIDFNGKPTKFDPAVAGITLDVDETMEGLPEHSWVDRVVPLWPYIKTVKKTTVQPVIKRDEAKINKFAETLVNNERRDPVNASAVVKDGDLKVKSDEDGEIYSVDEVKKPLRSANLFTEPPVLVKPRVVPADIQTEDYAELVERIKNVAAKPVKIRYGNTTKTVEGKVAASWFKATNNLTTKKPELVIDPAGLDPSFKVWNQEYTIAPGTTQLTLVDNVETARRNGASGRTLDAAGVQAQLVEWSKNPAEETITLKSSVLAPKIIATRIYSQSSAGLLAKLKYWLETHPGNYQVAIQELGGQGRAASYNVSKQTVMASTYKTFLAFVAYKQAESGALNLGQGLHGSRNIEQCIAHMIINSDNDCAIALGRLIGWAKVDQIIAANGFSNVKLNNYNSSGNLSGDKLVNAETQVKFIAQLSQGQLINSAHTGTLLGYMKQQRYRDGIPKGSHGAVVADKVGFLDGYLHDVGVVYAPNATYALVIMSSGSSWSNISSLASAIYEFMNE